MARTFFFYDLETSGLSPRHDRIMQFAGQRTDENLEPIGEPINILVALNDDVLPSPDAIMVTGISPQQTVQEGYTEAQFAQLLLDEVFTPETITVGFNNIRFDDEFIRHLFWRTFRDPYEWSWRDGRSRWDILDVVRLTRALRPEGINWPVREGVAVNKLELLSAENGLAHEKAHDALSDVEALIGVTKLIRDKQPKLFDYLLRMRDKNEVKKLINGDNPMPFVYASGRYDSQFNKTTVAFPLTAGKNGNVIVYDLRYDPSHFVNLPIDQLKAILYASREERQAPDYKKVPIKELQYNRSPAVAPISVLEQGDGWKKLSLDPETIKKHLAILTSNPTFAENIRSIVEDKPEYAKEEDAEARLYDGFLNDRDRLRVETVRNADERQLADFHPEFVDERLPDLLLRYKARNYPRSLSSDEKQAWERWRIARLERMTPEYIASLQRLATSQLTDSQKYSLEELNLWLEHIAP